MSLMETKRHVKYSTAGRSHLKNSSACGKRMTGEEEDSTVKGTVIPTTIE